MCDSSSLTGMSDYACYIIYKQFKYICRIQYNIYKTFLRINECKIM